MLICLHCTTHAHSAPRRGRVCYSRQRGVRARYARRGTRGVRSARVLRMRSRMIGAYAHSAMLRVARPFAVAAFLLLLLS